MAILSNFTVSSHFGNRRAPKKGASTFHKGIDLAAPTGTPIHAANEGVITHKAYQKGYGNVVYIKHRDGTETRYAHMSNFANIQPGMTVQAGQEIGYVGSTGESTGPHLHFEVRNAAGEAIDPTLVYGPQLDQIKQMPGEGLFYNPNYLATRTADIPEALLHQQQTIAFNIAPRKPQETAVSFLKNMIPSLLSGNFFTAVLGGALAARETTSSKEDIPLNLTVEELKNNGFSPVEIQKLSLLSQNKKTANSNPLNTLNQHAQCITEKDMESIGLGTDKIEMISQLAQKNMA